ncbi:BnaC05g50570D [Brassica napus]|uniref:BnaC05g50570D protein n=1 Tax=Brassica napus TaxID=3708 RepID=A0A078IAN0_BRANA|nr:BnaC05g50570D [Brassica napus]
MYSHLKQFTFLDLKLAIRNFRPESLLREGGFGCVFKGWVEENGTAPVKPGTGLTVAVKTLNLDSLQGHKEWLTSSFEIPLIAASTSSGSLDPLNPQYSPAATCVFFDVARTFSKSNQELSPNPTVRMA